MLLFLTNLFNNNKKFQVEISKIELKEKNKIFFYLLLFILLIISILRIVNFWVVFIITLLIFFFFDKKIFLKIDYYLLGTFLLFFIFVDNIVQIDFLNSFVSNNLIDKQQTLVMSILASQIISNVPTAILFSGFTDNYKELLLGVNIGGLGTILASLANLISFKFYIKAYGRKGFLLPFHIINFLLLIIISIFFILFF